MIGLRYLHRDRHEIFTESPNMCFVLFLMLETPLTTNTNQRNSWKNYKEFEKKGGARKKNREILASTQTARTQTAPRPEHPTRLGSCLWAHPSGPQPFGPQPIRNSPSLPSPRRRPGDLPPRLRNPRRPHLDPQGGGVGWRGVGQCGNIPKGLRRGALKGGFEGGVLALSGKKRKTWPKSNKLSMIFFWPKSNKRPCCCWPKSNWPKSNGPNLNKPAGLSRSGLSLACPILILILILSLILILILILIFILILSFSQSVILSFSHSLMLSFSHSLILSCSHALMLSFSHSLILRLVFITIFILIFIFDSDHFWSDYF